MAKTWLGAAGYWLWLRCHRCDARHARDHECHECRPDRREEEWKHQADLASKELVQIDKQIAAAEIRKAIAEQEIKNHDKQIENAKKVDECHA